MTVLRDSSVQSDRRYNNFDLLRLLAAWFVLFSHCYPLAGRPGSDPYSTYVGLDTLGGLGVSIFFVLSGYLVTQSWDRARGPIDFIWKRIRRIFPALAICVLLCVLIVGPLMTTLDVSAYFHHSHTREYAKTATAWSIRYVLPGVFTGNPVPNTVNGSLWSLPYEILCYLCLLVSGIIPFALRWKVLLTTITIATMLLLRPSSPPAGAFDQVFGLDYYHVKLGLTFATGALFYCWREQLRPRAWLGIMAIAFAWWLPQSPLRVTLYVLGVSTAVLAIALRWRFVPKLPSRMGDWSYGLYLYAFPVQQLLAAGRVHEKFGFASYVILCTTISLAAAGASWFLVERWWLRPTPKPNVSDSK